MTNDLPTTMENYREGTAFEFDDGLAVGGCSFGKDEDRPPTSLGGSGGQETTSCLAVTTALTMNREELERKLPGMTDSKSGSPSIKVVWQRLFVRATLGINSTFCWGGLLMRQLFSQSRISKLPHRN